MWLQIPYTQIDWAFTKWFIGWYNQINVPASYSTYLRNCRIENESIIMRDGFRAYTSMSQLWKYRKLKNVGGELYALIQKKGSKRVHLFHLLPNNYYDLWEIWTESDFDWKDEVDIVAVWDMAIVLWKKHKPQYSVNGSSVQELSNAEMVNVDWGTAIDENFSSCMWAYYSSNVFINEVEKKDREITDPDTWDVISSGTDYVKTNRVIVSHFVNRDTNDWRENARNFSAQRQELWNNETQQYDETEIPYKIVCPTTVTWIIWTMQNLYIFCEDSIQYLDQTILQEYRNSKSLRTVPIANWYELNNHHLATAAGNFVFFFSRDKHVRSIGYTSGIYDPQIADLTDTEFWIQRWINDNIADDQSEGFAFFNKKDQTVEFHLTSKKAYPNSSIRNDITLIRDLQHQAWLIDTGKYFGAMENFNRPRTATGKYAVAPRYDDGEIPDELERSWVANVVAGGTWLMWYRPTTQDLDQPIIAAVETDQFYYQTEDKYDTTFSNDDGLINIQVHPIEFEYDTTNIGLVGKKTELAEMKLFSGARITWAINIHAGNTRTVFVPQTQTEETYEGTFKVTVYIDGVKQCEKKLERQNIYDYYKKYQIEVWGPELKPYDPTDRKSVLEYDRLLFPMDLVLDQSMIRKKGKRIRLKIECATPGADLYLSGLAIQAKQLGHFDLADKY